MLYAEFVLLWDISVWICILIMNCVVLEHAKVTVWLIQQDLKSESLKKSLPNTAKQCPYSQFFWSEFLTFGMNMEIYRVNFYFQSKYRKIRTRKIPKMINNPLGHTYMLLLCFCSKFVAFKLNNFLETSYVK